MQHTAGEMSASRFQTASLCLPLKSGEMCRALVHFGADGELSIECAMAQLPPVQLPPNTDPWTVEARAEALLIRKLIGSGLL